MTIRELQKKLEKKEYAPVYLLHGEEPYYIDLIANYIEAHVLDENEKAFNQLVLYGKDVDARTVGDYARRYPVMAPKQVIIVREAQLLKDIDSLDAYAGNPIESTVLVLCHKHKKYDGRKKLAGTVAKKGVVFESAKLYDNQVPAWIHDYVTAQQFSIQPEAAQMMADYLGTDLAKIANELDKLFINIPKGTQITSTHIQDNIGISKDFNVFELQSAIARRDTMKVAMIVDHFAANPKDNPLVVVNASLYNFFSQLFIAQYYRNASEKELTGALYMRDASPEDINKGWQRLSWKLKDIKAALPLFNRTQIENAIHLLKEYDLKSKGVGSDNAEDGDLLKEMIWQMIS